MHARDFRNTVRGTLAAIGLLFCLPFLSASAFAQSNTGRLVGTVTDTQGKVVAGATVVLTDELTKKEKTVTSDSSGAFILPQLEVGSYAVKVSVEGYKTFEATAIKIDIGREYSIAVKLEVGTISEVVTVSAGTNLINSTTGALQNTVSTKQIIELPLVARNPLNLIQLQAGVASNGAQNTSINGQRTTFTNITRDGINVQDAFIRTNATDFSPERASVDNTGEFTLTTQNAGADSGYGAAQVQLVTPRGTNEYHGALFYFNRNGKLSANDFFNNRANIARPFRNRNQFGGKVGGPIPFTKDKAFFFFNFERLTDRIVSQRNRTILLPGAAQGNFTYREGAAGTGPTRTVNLFTLLNQVRPGTGITGIDPVVQQRILGRLPSTGNRTDIGDQLNTTGFTFNQGANTDRNNYATRIDYDLSERHTINGVFTYNKEDNLRPDVDGGEGFLTTPVTVQSSTNKLLALAYRWTPSARLTNELRGGLFFSGVPFDRTTAKPAFFINNPIVSNPEVTFLNQGRDVRTYNIQDNADYTIGNHSLKFGALIQLFEVDPYNEAGIVPTFTLGTNPNTPQFTAANFPGGISPTQLNTANALLATLGGIVSAGTQSFNVASRTSGFQPVQRLEDYRYSNYAYYVSDQWRARPNLTLNMGLRYELFPAPKLNNGLLLEPVIKGRDPLAAILDPNGTYDFIGNNAGGNRFHNTDRNNFAPVFSLAYSPKSENGFLKAIFGSDMVVRGGFSMSYVNDSILTTVRNANIGNQGLGTTASAALQTINNAQTNQLNARFNSLPGITPPSVIVPRTFAQNNGPAFGNFGTVFAVDPDLQTPRVTQYSFGIQRSIGFDTVLEIRYVGNQSSNLNRSIDFNQIDIRENGFIDDFNRARRNLVANGDPSRGEALTVFPRLAGGGLLNNAAIRNQLILGTPADLALLYIQNALTGGVRFLPNPNTGVANLFTNGSNYNYNALQIEVRKRFSKGFYFQSNYTFQKILTNAIGTSQQLVEPFLDNRQPSLEYTRADYDSTHIFNFNGIYDLPFGRGQKFFSGVNGVVDRLIGGWQITSILRASSGAPITFVDPRGTLNRAGRAARQTPNSTLSIDQLKDLTGTFVTARGIYFINPSIVNPATGRAAEGFGTANFNGQVFTNVAPGETGKLARGFLNGPFFFNMDFSILKNIRVTERTKLQLRFEAFNLLNNVNFFIPQIQNINSATFGQYTASFGARVIQVGGRFEF